MHEEIAAIRRVAADRFADDAGRGRGARQALDALDGDEPAPRRRAGPVRRWPVTCCRAPSRPPTPPAMPTGRRPGCRPCCSVAATTRCRSSASSTSSAGADRARLGGGPGGAGDRRRAGLGAAFAEALAAAGAAVALADVRPEVEDVARQLADRHRTPTVALVADMAVPNDVWRMVDDTVAAFGGIDILVNNAAICRVDAATRRARRLGGGVRRDLRREHPWRVPVRAGGDGVDARTWRRPHRQHRHRSRVHRAPAADRWRCVDGRLRRLQVGRERDDAGVVGGAGRAGAGERAVHGGDGLVDAAQLRRRRPTAGDDRPVEAARGRGRSVDRPPRRGTGRPDRLERAGVGQRPDRAARAQRRLGRAGRDDDRVRRVRRRRATKASRSPARSPSSPVPISGSSSSWPRPVSRSSRSRRSTTSGV